MLAALNTPEWKRLFAHPDLKELHVSRKDVIGFVGRLNVPDHETYSACRDLCSAGYLALLVLDGQLFLLVHANCDLSLVDPAKPIAHLRMSVNDLIKELSPADRQRLGIETLADRNLARHTSA